MFRVMFPVVYDKCRPQESSPDDVAYLNGQPSSRPIVFHALFTSSCLATRLATLSRLSKEALSPRLFEWSVISP